MPIRNACWAHEGRWFANAVIKPFADFCALRLACAGVAGADGTYRISDVVMGIMANPFYVDMGYTRTRWLLSPSGVIMTIAGAWIGGLMSPRFGNLRILMLGAILFRYQSPVPWLSGRARCRTGFADDNLAGGIASAALLPICRTRRAHSGAIRAVTPSCCCRNSCRFLRRDGEFPSYAAFFNTTAIGRR